ncbi:MAG TPA: hypothetical protein VGC31_10095 [Paenirhodobacter sp.]
MTPHARETRLQAQLALGQMLLNSGDGSAAWEAFAAAARSHDGRALNMLGMCYEDGRGTGTDPAQARAFFGAGARRGDCWAQFNLARQSWAEGQPETAIRWFEASLATGFKGYWNALIGALQDIDDPHLQEIAQRARRLGDAAPNPMDGRSLKTESLIQ